jgi:hypothetical protein
MHTIKATDGLVIEVWYGDDEGDERSMVRLRSLLQERDGNAPPGAIVIWPEEVRHLIGALAEAASLLAEEAASKQA